MIRDSWLKAEESLRKNSVQPSYRAKISAFTAIVEDIIPDVTDKLIINASNIGNIVENFKYKLTGLSKSVSFFWRQII